jgi:tetratricopeptide (TPR) repeat protein
MAGLVILAIVCGCATTEKRAHYQIELHEEAYVTVMNGKPQLKPAGEVLDFDQDELPLYIQKPGYLGVFIVPTNAQSEKISVALEPFDVWGSEWGQRHADRSLQEVLIETARVQHLFASNNPQAALDRIDALEAKYPKIHALKFLKASCLLLLGEKERAKFVLEEALRAWPNNRAGLDLFKSLTGHEYVSDSVPKEDPVFTAAPTEVPSPTPTATDPPPPPIPSPTPSKDSP